MIKYDYINSKFFLLDRKYFSFQFYIKSVAPKLFDCPLTFLDFE